MLWTPCLPISNLPENIRTFFIQRAGFLLNDLELNVYSSILVPIKNSKIWSGQLKREVVTRNPYWYSKFYWENTPHKVMKSGKKIRLSNKQFIWRGHVKSALNRIVESKDIANKRYHTLLRDLVLNHLLNGTPVSVQKTKDMSDICLLLEAEPINFVRRYFGMCDIPTFDNDREKLVYHFGYLEGERLFYRYLTQIFNGRISAENLIEKHPNYVPF